MPDGEQRVAAVWPARSQAVAATGGRYFGCRICHDLTYESRQTSDKRLSWFRRNEDAVMMMIETGDLDSLGATQLMLLARAMR